MLWNTVKKYFRTEREFILVLRRVQKLNLIKLNLFTMVIKLKTYSL